jgi:heptosyltransferase II
MVMATPLLAALRGSFQGELWAIGKSTAMHMYNGLDLFDRFIPLDSKGMVKFLDTVTFLRKLKCDRGILLPHSFRSALLFFAARVRERIGYARNRRGFMLTRSVPEGPDIEPTVEHYLRIVDALGGARVSESPFLSVTEDEEQHYYEKQGYPEDPYIAFIAGAQYGPSKCWPEGHFAALADLIADRLQMKTFILPGKGEEKMASRLLARVKRKETMEILSLNIADLKVCLAKAAAVISNDTGPRHIAAALGVPTIVLMGPMDDRYTSYRAPSVHLMARDVPCKPCNKPRCDRGHECLAGIQPVDVMTKLEEVL